MAWTSVKWQYKDSDWVSIERNQDQYRLEIPASDFKRFMTGPDLVFFKQAINKYLDATMFSQKVIEYVAYGYTFNENDIGVTVTGPDDFILNTWVPRLELINSLIDSLWNGER